MEARPPVGRPSLTTDDRWVWQPIVLDRTRADDDSAFAELVERGRVWRLYDTLEEQLDDLVRARNPRKRKLTRDECRPHVAALLGDTPIERYGRWVYYPWSGDLVHLLGPEAFAELRSDRNRYKITPEEAARLREVTVGIVGLSVGNVIALTLALEGAAGHLKLADHDHLELSNMNRIRAGVHQLGLPKTVLAARQIVEIDPYARLTVFHDGLTESNLDAFLLGDPPVDILLDECDGIAMKFRLRERARELRLPVLMETSDRGMLDVERFDLEPERPIFHGLVGDVPASELVDIDNERKATLMMKIIGARTTSTRACASLMEIDRTISAWPQLASDVTLGGASATMAIRRLALGQPIASGRSYLDIEHTIAVGAGPVPIAGADRPAPLPEAGAAGPHEGLALVPEPVRFVVEHAVLAPSGGNCQPWHFHWDGRHLWLNHDRIRSRNLLDRRQHGTALAMGAALENLSIAAAARELEASVTPYPVDDPDVIARIELSTQRGKAADGALLPLVRQRCTNRRQGARQALKGQATLALLEAAAQRDARLELCLNGGALDEIGSILGAGDRIRVLCPELHREMMGELRWTSEEAERTRDDLDLATLELTAFQRAAMEVLARADVASEARRRTGRGRALEEMARDAIAGASAVGLLSFTGTEPQDWLAAGRAVQRVWLAATEHRLAMQPMTAILYMFELLADRPDIFSPAERDELATLRARLDAVFPASVGRTQAFLFRLAHADEPSARSLRLPLDHVLELGSPVPLQGPPDA